MQRELPYAIQEWATVARPMPTLGISPDSVGNVLVTCRSAENRVEGQLPDQVNSHYRPQAVGRLVGEIQSAIRAILSLPSYDVAESLMVLGRLIINIRTVISWRL